MGMHILVVVAIVMTASAQVLLKKASFYEIKTFWWLAYFGSSGAMYVLSFILYAHILKYFPLNKIYPAMTVGQIMLVTILGFMLGEVVAARHAVGLMFGMMSIYLILS